MIPAVYPLLGLGACLAALAAIALAPGLKAFRHLWFALAAVAAILYAGTKPDAHLWCFTFENGLTDAGSTCSNDVIMASWTFRPSYAPYVFRWAYRDLTVTNAVGECVDPYHQLPDALVSDGVAVALVENATNMQVVCWAQHVSPPQVVTNGVYHLNGVMRSLDTTNSPLPKYATPGIAIRATTGGGTEQTLTPTNAPPDYSQLMSTQSQGE